MLLRWWSDIATKAIMSFTYVTISLGLEVWAICCWKRNKGMKAITFWLVWHKMILLYAFMTCFSIKSCYWSFSSLWLYKLFQHAFNWLQDNYSNSLICNSSRFNKRRNPWPWRCFHDVYSLHFLLSFRFNCKDKSNTKDHIWPHFQTSRISSKNTPQRFVFSTVISVFGNLVKHCEFDSQSPEFSIMWLFLRLGNY